ncbi:sulfotransferase [Palleronia sp. KMU-117]|uniref:sulfotransferase n=1 Tax=Palleronia sp. KMU-117 TaxID=3434108 RepID=UPI003D7482BE
MAGQASAAKAGRNDPCPCGSGKKYKACCLRKAAVAAPRAAALLEQAQGHEDAGRLPQALALFRQLAALPGDALEKAEGHLGIARTLMAMDDERGAVPHLEAAAALRPFETAVVAAIASTLLRLGRPDSALSVARLGLRETPDSPDLLSLSGLALERLNRNDEAEPVLAKVIATAPRDARAASALARVYRWRKDNAAARRLLLATIGQVTSPPETVASLWNELGHVLDSLEDYDAAFKAFERSGAITLDTPKARAIDDTVADRRIAQEKAWITGGGLARIDRYPEADPRRLVFLVGFPRSGTTLTEQVMAAHSRVATSEEQPFLRDAMRALEARYGQGRPMGEILEAADRAALDEARSVFWRGVDAQSGRDHDVFVHKLPLSLTNIGTINGLFPSSRVILALRDPRDVCLSCFFQSFGLNRSMKKFLSWPTTVAFYAKVMGFWLDVRDRIDLPQIEVRYEDTVTDLPGQARRILDHLGVPWEDAVLAYYERTRKTFVNTPSYQAVRENVHTRATERWRNYPKAMEAALPVLRPYLDAFGYPLDGRSAP